MYLLNNFLSRLKMISIKAGVRLTGTVSGMGQMLEGDQCCYSAMVSLAHLLYPLRPWSCRLCGSLDPNPKSSTE